MPILVVRVWGATIKLGTRENGSVIELYFYLHSLSLHPNNLWGWVVTTNYNTHE